MESFMAAKISRFYCMKNVCVFGLGWLGKQIVNSLLDGGFKVVGVNRSLKKELLVEQFEYDLNRPKHQILQNLKDAKFDCFIITVPPSSSEEYAETIIHFLNSIYSLKTKIIFTGSTAIYGEEERDVIENSLLNPESNNAKEIEKIEKFIQTKFIQNGIILRLAGLVGADRHPIKYLSGRTNLSNGAASVNLIHAEEILSFLIQILKEWKSGVFNLCNPDHPSKANYYTNLAKELKIDIPRFNLVDKSLGKRVYSNRLKDLNFEFKYKLLTDFPKPTIS